MFFRTCIQAVQAPFRHFRISLWFFGLNAALSLGIFLPLRHSIEATVGYSLYADKLRDGLNLAFLVEHLSHHSAAFGAATALLPLVVLVSFLMGLLLSTGALAVFLSDSDSAPGLFWTAATGNFGRMLRLTLWMVPLVGLGTLLVVVTNAARSLLIGEGALESVVFWSYVPVGVIAASIGLLLFTLYDYAKAEILSRNEPRSRWALLQAFRLVGRHPVSTVGFLLTSIVLGLAALFAYSLITGSTSFVGLVGTTTIICLQQLTILWRQLSKVFRYAGVASFHRQLTPPAPAASAVPPPEAAVQADNSGETPSG